MGWRDYFGSGAIGNRRKGLARTKQEFNKNSSPAEKERIYKKKLGIFGHLAQNQPDEIDRKDPESIAVTDIEDFSAVGGFSGVIDDYNSYVYATEASKEQKVAVYREMARYPEIAFAVNEYVTEGINKDDKGRFMKLSFTSKELEENKNIRKTLEFEFDNLFWNVLKVHKYGKSWFREFIVDGEIGFEKVINSNRPQEGIKKLKKLRTQRLHPISDDPELEDFSEFVYKSDSEIFVLTPEMVAYANSGIFEWNSEEDDKMVISILEDAKQTYRRLKQLEDALVIYRIVRAPERRIFEIDVGEMPKARAEQYIKDLMRKYRQREYFDPRTGEVQQQLDPKAMTEDFWFPRSKDGKGPTVSTLPGGDNLGEIADVEYFLHKLYRGLKIPLRRYETDTGFSIGDTSDITQEEVRFNEQVSEFVERFAEVFMQTFMTHLELKGIVEEIGLDSSDVRIEMFQNNLFKKFFEAKELELRFSNIEHFAEFMDTEVPKFSAEWVFKKYGGISTAEWDENEELLEGERKVAEELAAEEEEVDEDLGL